MLTREQILQSDDLPRETVPVPEWGGEVQVRTMTGTDRDAFEASLIGKEGRLENVRARLVSLTLCDESGSRLFSDGDIAALGGKSAKALDRVFAVSQRLNGIGADQVDAAKTTDRPSLAALCVPAGAGFGPAGARDARIDGLG